MLSTSSSPLTPPEISRYSIKLVPLFRARADIPGEEEFPEVEPRLPTYRFPDHVLTAARLARALDAPRLARLRNSVAAPAWSGSGIRYLAPWHDAALDGRLADMVLSQAVLEHVDDLAHAYQKMYDWLKPGGVMSHVIDFRCHHTARSWNGHWTYSDFDLDADPWPTAVFSSIARHARRTRHCCARPVSTWCSNARGHNCQPSTRSTLRRAFEEGQ